MSSEATSIAVYIPWVQGSTRRHIDKEEEEEEKIKKKKKKKRKEKKKREYGTFGQNKLRDVVTRFAAKHGSWPPEKGHVVQ